jgi:hypothetical protein
MVIPANIPFSSITLAELYSGPTARYNGELISPSVKEIKIEPKPEGYQYGAVSGDATPALFVGAFLVVALAAFVPGFLSAGESAKKQNLEFEKENKIGYNSFAAKARADDKKAPVVVVKPKNSGKK